MRLGYGFAVTIARRTASTAFAFANAEAAAFMARQSGHTLSIAHIAAFDSFISSLKSAGLWGKCDQLIWLNPRLADARLNVTGVSNSATFTNTPEPQLANPSYFVDGRAGGESIGLMASASGVQFQQDSAFFGAFLIEGETGRSSTVAADSVSRNLISGRNATNFAVMRVNSATSMTSTAAVASGYGWIGASRVGAADTRMYKGGAEIGSSAAASALRTANPILLGSGNGQPQGFALAWLGAGLNATEANALEAAVNTFMAATGVHSLPSVRQSVSYARAATIKLPDGLIPPATLNRGMPNTGIAPRLGDGRWLQAVGLGTMTDQAGVAILNTGFTAIDAQYSFAGWGLGAASAQGVTVDTNGDGIVIQKDTTGGVARLVRFTIATGAFVSATVLTGFPSGNGIAVDTKRNRLILSTTADNRIRWLDKATLLEDTAIPQISVPADMLFYDVITDTVWATGGTNGSDGYAKGYSTRDYGGMWLARDHVLQGALAIEGLAFAGRDATAGTATIWTTDDRFTHGQGDQFNSNNRYDAVAV